MVEGREFAVVFAFATHLFKAAVNHFAEQFLGFDERYLHIAVRVAVESELTGNAFGE